MKRHKVRVCVSVSVDKQTLRLMDRLARTRKISRSGGAELAIRVLGERRKAESTCRELPLAGSV
jgi:hypothetical protein